MTMPTLRKEIVVDYRLTVADAESLLTRLKGLKCGDPTELWRYPIGEVDGTTVVFSVGLRQ